MHSFKYTYSAHANALQQIFILLLLPNTFILLRIYFCNLIFTSIEYINFYIFLQGQMLHFQTRKEVEKTAKNHEMENSVKQQVVDSLLETLQAI